MRELLICTVVYLLWRVLWLSRKHKWRSTVAHEVTLALFAASIVWIISKTAFPPWNIYGTRHINTTLFASISRSWREWTLNHSARYFITNVIGNIVLFVPFGFMLPLSLKTKQGLVVLYGFVFSLAIEIAQYPLGRWSDVDDLWLNTLGAAIGLLLYTAIRVAAPKFAKRCKVS